MTFTHPKRSTWRTLWNAATLFLLLMLGAAAPGHAQQWNYTYYQQNVPIQGQARLERAGQDGYTLQLLFQGGTTDYCLRGPMEAQVEVRNGSMFVTPVQPGRDCLAFRLVFPTTEGEGLRQVRNNSGAWVNESVGRNMTPLGPQAGWFKDLSARLRQQESQAARPAPAAPAQAVATRPQPAPAPASPTWSQTLPSPPATPAVAAAPAATPQPAPARVAAAAPAQQRLKARALVIGNSAYASFGRLPNPRNDAQAIAAKFRAMGIEVDLLLDADRDSFVKALNEYAQRAGGVDINILYYAGHGVQVEGINYLVPTNMRADGISAGYIKLSGISLNAALDYMPGTTRLVFLDACRDNPASRSLVATRSAGTVGLAPVNTTSGTLIAYATKDGATADDGQGRHSPYTAALLEHLDRPDDIAVVLRRVRQSVMRATSNRQEPWEYGSLIGEQLVLSQIAR
ncbi:MAG: caspase family protein [Pseudomonadota bacterium]